MRIKELKGHLEGVDETLPVKIFINAQSFEIRDVLMITNANQVYLEAESAIFPPLPNLETAKPLQPKD